MDMKDGVASCGPFCVGEISHAPRTHESRRSCGVLNKREKASCGKEQLHEVLGILPAYNVTVTCAVHSDSRGSDGIF